VTKRTYIKCSHERAASVIGQLCLVLMAACGGLAADESAIENENTELGVREFDLNNGTMTSVRPEIGQIKLTGGCTATLIAPRYVLTARHCNALGDDVPAGASFTTGNGITRTIDRLKTLGVEDAPIGDLNPDVMLARLSSPIQGITPANLSDVPPLPGDAVTVFGFGCNSDPNLSGKKQFVSWTYGPGQFQICPGDSGGPAVFGSVNATGSIWGVNSFTHSSGDVRGDVSRFKEQILQIIRAWEGTGEFEVGIDRPGAEITNVFVPNATVCRQFCIGNSQCRAYTFSSGGSCSLKRAIPGWKASTCSGCTSGIRPMQEQGIDRPGNDLSNFSLSAPRAELCASECAANASCAAYTYVPPGPSNNPPPHCWLKNAVPATINASGLVSGVRATYEMGVNRPGYDLRSIATSSADTCKNACEADNKCRAFVQSAAAGCQLKYAAAPPVAANGFISGVRRGVESFTDRPGSDMAGSPFFVDPPFIEICQASCESTAACRAFTFVYMPLATSPEGPDDADNARCYLKSSVPAPTTQPTNSVYQRIFSGVKNFTIF
jgi:hypothetical protein